MGVPAHLNGYTFAEYLDLEQSSNVKHEYLDGEIYGMAGGSPRHAALALAAGSALLGQLRGGPCHAFNSDLRVRVLPTGLATYPDVTIVCGSLERDPQSATTVTNPRLIVEILSPSTADYGRREKFEHYAKIPSLMEVIYVSQDEVLVEHRRRGPDGSWSSTRHRAGETVVLDAISCRLDVDELYRGAPAT